MIIGYILDHVLGLLLGIAVVSLSTSRQPHLLRVLQRGLAAFHECASFFAFSIEIAAIVMLVKVDLGVSTGGMGTDTVRITYAVTMLVLLPLLYSVLAPPTTGPVLSQDNGDVSGVRESRPKPLMLFVICWALAFYPFYSAMNAAFGPSLVSNGSNAALSVAQLRTIGDICFRDTDSVTSSEANLMTAFVLLTYLPISIVLISNVLWSGIERNHEGSALHRRLEDLRGRIPGRAKSCGMVVGLAAIPTLAAGLLWSVLRARQAQKQMAETLGGGDGDSDWTFGQVAAVTLFSPVVFECWNGFVSHRIQGMLEAEADSETSEK